MAAHRRDEESVHCTFGRHEQIRRFRSVEASPSSRRCELMVEGFAEAKEGLHGLAERQTEVRGRDALLCGRGFGRFEVALSRLSVRRGRLSVSK